MRNRRETMIDDL